MSRSNTYGNVTLVLTALAVLVFMIAVTWAIISEQYAGIHQAYSAYQQTIENDRSETARGIANVCSNREPTAFANCLADQMENYFRQRATNQDLQVQKEMAFWAKWMFIASCFTVVIAATGLYFIRDTLIETRGATEAASNQVRLSRLSMLQTQRAFVFQSKMHAVAAIKESTSDVVEWHFFPIWENGGNTPARSMYMHTNWMAFVPDIPDDFDYSDLGSMDEGERPIMMLGPKATTFGGKCAIPIEEIRKAIKDKCTIYFWGWVEYDDVFEGTSRHRTEYAIKLLIDGDPSKAVFEDGSPNIPFVYQGGGVHNGADDECMKRPFTTAPKHR